MKMTKIVWLAPMVMATMAFAHGGVKDPTVMARMQVMEDVGQGMKIISQMLKKEIPFNAEAAQAATHGIASAASQTVAKFKDPATDPKSEALPAIWKDFDDFSDRAMTLEKTARRQASTIQSYDDLKVAAGELAGTCKGCHSRYKK